ncbi:TetR family transcriptional regulator [Catellatospora sp. TT07R-123]|uniref:TetR/AcrR family transcriptional regulator n=1 Tax=Catellatospora sp. TT07R-123 TaxID=2733863 RepID=UPI001B195EF6|nr:TetR/AcrR family transcriptional regulator [Catellatospora sp. TT07R-123]GHJ48938.1 TetR family transcriptional regulator [Catellatospora sp. TT07R-123]
MKVYGVDKASTKERVAAVAREILTTEGADAVSMRRVAQAVGLTPMALYRHFDNREALLRHVADECFAEIARRWSTGIRQGTPVERLSGGVDDYLDFALREPKLYAFLFGERRDDARMFPEDFRARRSPTLNLLVEQLTAGIEGGVFRDDDVWEVAITVAALLHGFVELYHGGRIGLDEPGFRALCHAALERMFDGIKA